MVLIHCVSWHFSKNFAFFSHGKVNRAVSKHPRGFDVDIARRELEH